MRSTDRARDIAGIPTRYVEAGEGRPILLVHGGDFRAPSHSVDWDLNIDELAAAGFRVIAVDKLGQGQTAAPEHPEGYTMQAVCDHMAALVEELDLTDVTLVGHSRGAMPVLQYALNRPERVHAVVIAATATVASRPITSAAEFYRRAFEGMTDRPDASVVDREPTMNSYSTEHMTEAFRAARLAAARSTSAARARRVMAEGAADTYFFPDVDRLRAATVRRLAAGELQKDTLVVWGRNDPSAPVELAYELLDTIAAPNRKRTELHVFNHAGHYSYREHPKAFNRLVAGFAV